MNYFKIMIGLFMSFCSCVNSVDKSELSSMDYELFYYCPLNIATLIPTH